MLIARCSTAADFTNSQRQLQLAKSNSSLVNRFLHSFLSTNGIRQNPHIMIVPQSRAKQEGTELLLVFVGHPLRKKPPSGNKAGRRFQSIMVEHSMKRDSAVK